MRNFGYALTLIGLVSVFTSASLLDSTGKMLAFAWFGLAAGALALIFGYLIVKGYSEDEEDDF